MIFGDNATLLDSALGVIFNCQLQHVSHCSSEAQTIFNTGKSDIITKSSVADATAARVLFKVVQKVVRNSVINSTHPLTGPIVGVRA